MSTQKFVLYPRASIYFGLLLIVTFIGFYNSYFAKLGETDLWHHIHGTSAGLWMLLLIVQPILYQKGLLSIHRKLGRTAFVLLPLIVIGGIKMVHSMVNSIPLYPPNAPYQLSFLDLSSLGIMVLFFSLAMIHRRNVHNHARYMTLTALIVMPPAFGRVLFLLPWFDNFDKVLNVTFVVIELILLLLIWDDNRSGKIRRPYLLGLALFALLHLGLNFAAGWGWWRNLMDRFGSV